MAVFTAWMSELPRSTAKAPTFRRMRPRIGDVQQLLLGHDAQAVARCGMAAAQTGSGPRRWCGWRRAVTGRSSGRFSVPSTVNRGRGTSTSGPRIVRHTGQNSRLFTAYSPPLSMIVQQQRRRLSSKVQCRWCPATTASSAWRSGAVVPVGIVPSPAAAISRSTWS